jgi:hypothetical protein
MMFIALLFLLACKDNSTQPIAIISMPFPSTIRASDLWM